MVIHLVAAEQLPEGSGTGDFDASLLVLKGPQYAGELFLLGGVPDIEIGKLAGKHILLTGQQVSRAHARLTRVDFGPSRWRLVDNHSTNGALVNGQRIAEQELHNGDRVRIGEYELKYGVNAVAAEPLLPELVDAGPEEPPLAMPAAPAEQSPVAVAQASPKAVRPLNYATPQYELKLLGDCDINWVMKLRNASTLMMWYLTMNVVARWLPNVFGLPLLANGVGSLMSLAAAWLLTAREPDAPENILWKLVRYGLRLFATVAAVGEIMIVLGGVMENVSMMLPGAALALAAIPLFFLFLFYLWKLALRLPNRALAANALVVMVGLPVSAAMVMIGVITALLGSAAPIGATRSLAIMVVAAMAFVVFRIWYVILLIWFNKSFS